MYLDYGFVFIQDMAERALVEEIVACKYGGGKREGGG